VINLKFKIILTIIVCLILIGAVVLVINYNFDSEITEEKDYTDDEPPLIVGNISSFDDAVNVFGFNLFRQLSNDPEIKGNIFYSPYSVFTALAMTYEGAKGLTADEMADVLNIEQDNESFHKYVQTLYEYLNQNAEYNISTANALWVNEYLELLEKYLNIIQTYYGGNATNVDFSKPQETSDIINQWIENKTNNLIKDLIKPDYITPYTDLILTNAIYFKGIWEIQFDPANTTDKPFDINPGNTINVPTMHLIDTENLFNYTETDDLEILELCYSGDDISMFILLPKDETDLLNIINSIDNDKLSEWIKSMSQKNVDIFLPKFKVKTDTYKLKNHLINLGMPTAFTGSADFTGITDLVRLYISKVVHKAYIEVNEEGTEAAAATAVIMERSSIDDEDDKKVTFMADHPFMYLIQHKETETVLFMGTISDPTL
jgi:serpin B